MTSPAILQSRHLAFDSEQDTVFRNSVVYIFAYLIGLQLAMVLN